MTEIRDLLVIGGGINGCGIARDAAGRGLSVTLCEQGDLAQATSSSSTKLFHGGLRYLEYYEFRLVREALREREVLLRAMPHIAWPLRFVLPHHSGLRPAWLVRLGLFLYDHLGGRRILPGTRVLDLTRDPAGGPLRPAFTKGFEYSDCWVEDARLVVLNAVDAARRGARILTRTRCEGAERVDGHWVAHLRDLSDGTVREVHARALVNAGGPWVMDVIQNRLRRNSTEKVRLVRGSHIVVKQLFDHGKPYIFQQADGRIVFAIPYEQDFTLIGTTDAEHEGPPGEVHCSDAERRYLLDAVAGYFTDPPGEADVVWTYAGVRPLYDDGASSATAATRDYVLKREVQDGAALLNIFGGKITTYRRLAEAALAALAPDFPDLGAAWTAGAALPGGGFAHDGVGELVAELMARHGFLGERWAGRLVRAYGTEAATMLEGASSRADLGPDFGATLTGREVDWLVAREWAVTAEDILWRRTKLGLRVTPDETEALERYLADKRTVRAAS